MHTVSWIQPALSAVRDVRTWLASLLVNRCSDCDAVLDGSNRMPFPMDGYCERCYFRR